jgi:hypothetical protein
MTRSTQTPGMSIELTDAQLEQAVRAGMARRLLPGQLQALADRCRELAQDPRGLSGSLLTGVLVLASMPSDGSLIALSALAERLQMGRSKAHRYVTTLHALGLLEQDPRTRRYRLPTAPEPEDSNHPESGPDSPPPS